MASNENLLTFKGSGLKLLAKVTLYVLIGGLVLSVVFMGENWGRLFIFVTMLTGPFVLTVVLIAGLCDYFSFDDEKRVIVKRFSRAIPYDSVVAINVRRNGGLLQVSVRRGFLGRTTLVLGLKAGEEDRLMVELGRRFPQNLIRRTRLADHTILAGVLALIIAAGVVGHVYLYRKHPQLGMTPQHTAWNSGDKFSKKTPRYFLYTFSFLLPQNFALVIDKDIELVFQNQATKTKIAVAYGLRAEKGKGLEALVRRGLGIGDYADILDLSWSARIGIVPLVLKGIMLADLREASVHRLEQAPLRGFLMRGKRGNEEVVEILLMNRSSGEELELYLSGPKKAPDRLLQKIIGSVELVKGALPVQ